MLRRVDPQYVARVYRERDHRAAAVDGDGDFVGRVDMDDESAGLAVGEGGGADGAYAADDQGFGEPVERRGGRGELDVAEPVHGEDFGFEVAVADEYHRFGEADQ